MVRTLRGDESLNGLSRPDLFKIPNEIGDVITGSVTLNRRYLGKVWPASSGSAIVLTIPADTSSEAYIEGEFFWSYQYGAGQLSFAAANGVTIRTPTGLNASAQYALIGVMRLPGSNEWLACGSLTS